jgi:hypothetical protein
MPRTGFHPGHGFDFDTRRPSRRRPMPALGSSLELSDIIGSAADRQADASLPIRPSLRAT